MSTTKVNTPSNLLKIENITFGIAHVNYLNLSEAETPLTIDHVLTICANAWGVAESDIKCKLKHNKYAELVIQSSFLWAAVSYSNLSCKEVASYIGCYSCTVDNCCMRTNGIIEGCYKGNYKDTYNQGKFYDTILKIVTECEKESNNSGLKNVQKKMCPPLKKDMLGNTLWMLSLYQIDTLPIRPLSWFEGYIRKSLICIYKPGVKDCSTTVPMSIDEAGRLFVCQINGWRFAMSSDIAHIRRRHPVCDKCARKNNCPFVINLDGTLLAKVEKCFTPLEDNSLRVPAEFFKPFEKYQLQ